VVEIGLMGDIDKFQGFDDRDHPTAADVKPQIAKQPPK
jgi:hypothetical protein